jgi:hypothetical protein
MDGEGLFAVIGTVFGFLLFALWDILKERKRKNEERKRIIDLLKTELLDNLEICRNSKEMLSRDLKFIEETKTESVITPVSFSDSSWNIARSGDIMSSFNDVKLKKLSRLYSGFRMVNTVLASRDITRATSKALREYPSIIRAYNQRLIEMISTMEAETAEALKNLEK